MDLGITGTNFFDTEQDAPSFSSPGPGSILDEVVITPDPPQKQGFLAGLTNILGGLAKNGGPKVQMQQDVVFDYQKNLPTILLVVGSILLILFVSKKK